MDIDSLRYVDSGAEKEVIRKASTYLDFLIVPIIQLNIARYLLLLQLDLSISKEFYVRIELISN